MLKAMFVEVRCAIYIKIGTRTVLSPAPILYDIPGLRLSLLVPRVEDRRVVGKIRESPKTNRVTLLKKWSTVYPLSPTSSRQATFYSTPVSSPCAIRSMKVNRHVGGRTNLTSMSLRHTDSTRWQRRRCVTQCPETNSRLGLSHWSNYTQQCF